MTGDRNANVTSGETHGDEQEPREVEAADDPEEASDDFGESPDAVYGQREGQADPETGSVPRR